MRKKSKSDTTQWAFDFIVVILATCALVLLARTAHCQERCAQEVPIEHRRITLEHQGEIGIWSPLSVAECTIRSIEVCESLRSKEARVYMQRKQADEKLMRLMQVDLDESRAEVTDLRKALHELSTQDRTRSIIESPVLWGAVGLAAGGTAMYFVLR